MIPACLIVDDFPFNASAWRRAQCEALAYPVVRGPWSLKWEAQKAAAFMPVALLEQFADLVEEFNLRGKFTVLPMPGGWGRMDQSVRNLPDADRTALLKIVRDRLASRFDITPEVLTHTFAVDLDSGALLPHTETAWLTHLARHRRIDELCAYLRRAWQILTNLGFNPAGVTVGGMEDVSNIGQGQSLLRHDFAEDFAQAVALVHQEFDARQPISFLFTGWDPVSAQSRATLAPEKVIAHRQKQVYSIYARDTDPLLAVMDGCGDPSATAEELICSDSRSGALVDHIESGKALSLCIHSCTLDSLRTGHGLKVLETILRRLHDRYAARLRWMTPLEWIAATSSNEK